MEVENLSALVRRKYCILKYCTYIYYSKLIRLIYKVINISIHVQSRDFNKILNNQSDIPTKG